MSRVALTAVRMRALPSATALALALLAAPGAPAAERALGGWPTLAGSGLFTLPGADTLRAGGVSVSLNIVGGPVGSAIAGPLIGWSLNAALWFAIACTAAAAIFPILVIPAADDAA